MQRLHSLLLAELRAARRRLAGRTRLSATGIHRTRQHVKRARSLLRLLRSALNARGFARADQDLRELNRILREARDSTVILQTLQALGQRRSYLQPAAAAVQAYWRRHRSDYRGLPITLPDLSQARPRLMRVMRATQSWKLRGMPLRYALHDLRETYRKGRKRYRHAVRMDTDDAWHACRRQTKYLYYQLQLNPFSDLGVAQLVADARALEETLGAERDLMLLAAALQRTSTARSAAARGLLPVIVERRQRLLHKARARGARLYQARADQFERHLRRALRA